MKTSGHVHERLRTHRGDNTREAIVPAYILSIDRKIPATKIIGLAARQLDWSMDNIEFGQLDLAKGFVSIPEKPRVIIHKVLTDTMDDDEKTGM